MSRTARKLERMSNQYKDAMQWIIEEAGWFDVEIEKFPGCMKKMEEAVASVLEASRICEKFKHSADTNPAALDYILGAFKDTEEKLKAAETCEMGQYRKYGDYELVKKFKEGDITE